MDVAISWTGDHSEGSGAAVCESGALGWKAAVKSSTSTRGWSWMNLLHVNATLHGGINQKLGLQSDPFSVDVSPGALP